MSSLLFNALLLKSGVYLKKGSFMILISHRGNISGQNGFTENTHEVIKKALSLGYYVEVDVRYDHSRGFYFNHDEMDTPNIRENKYFAHFDTERMIYHAKDLKSLEMLKERGYHYFFHDKEEYTITSQGWIWANIGSKLSSETVCVCPEKGFNGNLMKCFGICSDFIEGFNVI